MSDGKIRVVFMGTPDFAVASLKAILDAGHDVVGVITAVDKPAGRGQKLRGSAVKQFSEEHGLRILQPANLKDDAFGEELKSLGADLFVVVAFRMLPEKVWAMPPKGTINLHASLLPQYRGAAPIQRSIMNGETLTGVSTFFITREIDTGKIIQQREVEITTNETAGSLHDKLMETGSGLLVETVNAIAKDEISAIDQSESPYNTEELREASKLHPEDCKVYWSLDAESVRNHVRGLNPFPAAWTELAADQETIRVKLFEVDKVDSTISLTPGQAVLQDGRLLVGCNDGVVEINELQMAGKKRMRTEDFLRGYTFPDDAKFV